MASSYSLLNIDLNLKPLFDRYDELGKLAPNYGAVVLAQPLKITSPPILLSFVILEEARGNTSFNTPYSCCIAT